MSNKKDCEFQALAEKDPYDLIGLVEIGYTQNIQSDKFLDAVEALMHVVSVGSGNIFREAALDAHELITKLLDHPWEHARECAVYVALSENLELPTELLCDTIEKLREMMVTDVCENVRLSCYEVLQHRYQ